MNYRNNLLALLAVCAVLAANGGLASVCQGAEKSPLPELTVDGKWLVNPAGEKVVLKGCNLGNWLLLEPWMLGDRRYQDQHDILTTLDSRFGSDRAEQLMDLYRANWITDREFGIVKSFGFTVVRVPFHYSLLINDANPGQLRKDAFEWLDRAVEMAEDAGVYVILDLHGTPGCQSADMTTGRCDQNRLWYDSDSQEQTLMLWRAVADRYKDRSCVVAYDMINEPWGTWTTDIRKDLVRMMDRIYRAIREVDPDTLILAAGSKRGIACYGDPMKRGWVNAGFTDHFYPGMFGTGDSNLNTHLDFLSYTVLEVETLLSGWDVPYLVGEFNVVFGHAAQPEMTRLYYDTFARNGWMSTLWSLRIMNPEGGIGSSNWYLATNAEPFAIPNLRRASYGEIEAAFEKLGSMKLAVDEELRDAVTATKPFALALPVKDGWKAVAAKSRLPKGWRSRAVGEASPGSASMLAEDVIAVAGTGKDIWHEADEFQYVYRKAPGAFSVEVWLGSLDTPNRLGKAGWMLRAGTDADDPHVLVHAFEDGRVMLAWRDQKGNETEEICLGIVGFPVGIGIVRDASGVSVRYTDSDGAWHTQAVKPIEALAGKGLIGLAVNSHDNYAKTHVIFEGMREDSEFSLKTFRGGKNLLRNGSFEKAKGKDEKDQADYWGRWGHWFNREDDWTPTRDGSCLAGYHHWQIESDESSGLFQDVSGLEPGKEYVFSIDACRDVPDSGSHGPATVELRLECPDGNRVLRCAMHSWTCEDIGADGNWSRLQVTGIAPTDMLRVVISVQPSKETPRGSALKFDNATLFQKEAHKQS